MTGGAWGTPRGKSTVSSTEAHRRLTFQSDHAPKEYRISILENVPLHRDIVAAWEEHGA